MPGRRRTSRPLFVTAALGAALVAGALPAAAAPSTGSATLHAPATQSARPAHAAPTAALGTHSHGLVTTLQADSSPEPGLSPTGTTTPAAEDDSSEGLPWTGIVVGGGLGLLAGIALMVLSKRRENRG